MHTIVPLPASTRAQLRSTQILTSLNQIVSELVQNSLDAGAKAIEVAIDCEEWSCFVTDDGCGISKESLSLVASGDYGGRYNSSKAYTPDSLDVLTTFGFRGEALASAGDICCLEICSRTGRSRETWSAIVKGGEKLYFGPAVRWRKEYSGTTVGVRDAFYNFPVRRRSHTSSAKTIETIKREVETFALVFPEVAFNVQMTRNTGTSTSSKEGILRIPKTGKTLETFRHLYGRALVEGVDNINVDMDGMEIHGFISLSGSPSKAYQFLYLNRHPLSVGDLHKIIDSCFHISSFSEFVSEPENRNSSTSLRRSPKKQEKKPVYVLNIIIPPREVDNCIEPSKNCVQFQKKRAVEDYLRATIDSFLVRHGFSSTPSSKFAESQPPQKRQKMDSENTSENVNENNRSSVPIFVQQDPRLTNVEKLWMDPNTGKQYIVDTRTGFSRTTALNESCPLQSTQRNSSEEVRGRRTLGGGTSHTNGIMPGWIRDALQANDVFGQTESRIPNLRIPVLNSTDEALEGNSLHRRHRTQQQQKEEMSRFLLSVQDDSHGSATPRFEKADLDNVQVINQVDRKFIACIIQCREHGLADSVRSLVLIDQHAADERIRVERFLMDICAAFAQNARQSSEEELNLPKTRDLVPPVPILLTIHEALRFKNNGSIRRSLANWGIHFLEPVSVCDNGEGMAAGYIQILISKIPEVVADKLLQGDELRDLVKGFLAKLETDTLPGSQDLPREIDIGDNSLVWLQSIRWCPRGLLDAINSKACRGAIMFNDTLSVGQCENVVRRLAETVFPFQCAHGRPSLVPLSNLGRLSKSTNGSRRRAQPKVNWSRLEE